MQGGIGGTKTVYPAARRRWAMSDNPLGAPRKPWTRIIGGRWGDLESGMIGENLEEDLLICFQSSLDSWAVEADDAFAVYLGNWYASDVGHV